MSVGRRSYLRLFMDGIQVPVQSASVSGGIGTHTQASIIIPPSPLITKLKPRTLVTLETKDSTDKASEPYRLLFQGEYVSYQHSEDSKSRNFVLQCIGLTNYWETVYKSYLDNVSLAAYGAIELAAFATAGTGATEIILPSDIGGGAVEQNVLSHGNDIHQALLSVVHMMGNTSGGRGNLNDPRINIHTERAYAVLRLAERVSVLPDEDIKTLISTKSAEAIFKKIGSSLGGLSTLSQVLRQFLAFAYYDWVAVVAPSYTPRNTSSGSAIDLDFFVPETKVSTAGGKPPAITKPEYLKGVAAGDPPVTRASAVPTTSSVTKGADKSNVQRDVILKPKTYFLPPPSCNLFFPCMYERFSSSRAFLQEPTRMRVRTQGIPWAAGSRDITAGFDVLTYYAPKELEKPVKDESAALKNNGKARSYSTLIKQAQKGGIDEHITGVIPSFEELGFAEYSAIAAEAGIDDDTPGKTATKEDPGGDDVGRNIQAVVDASGRKTINVPKAGSLQAYLQAASQYKLDLARWSARAVEGVSGPLNLNPVAGFPGLVFSKIAIYSGEIMNVGHSVSASGMAFTSVTLGLVRELDLLPGSVIGSLLEKKLLLRALKQAATADVTEESFRTIALDLFKQLLGRSFNQSRFERLVKGFDPVDRLPDQPKWLNSRYSAANIGPQVYARLLGSGVKSTCQLAGASSPVLNQVIAANIIFLEYLTSSNRVEYARKTTYRPVTTGVQAMHDFLGFSAPPNTSPDKTKAFNPIDLSSKFSGTTINGFADADIPVQKERVQAVKDYVSLLTGQANRGLRG